MVFVKGYLRTMAAAAKTDRKKPQKTDKPEKKPEKNLDNRCDYPVN